MTTNEHLDKRYANPIIAANSPFSNQFAPPPGLPDRPAPMVGREPVDTRPLEDILAQLEHVVGGDHEASMLLTEARQALEDLHG